MISAKDFDYSIHHLCICDDKPRENMWPYLRWHHGITNYFSGAVFHVTGEGHSDYTFMGCGDKAFQIQIEAQPFQFEYERNWWAEHGRGYRPRATGAFSGNQSGMDRTLSYFQATQSL